MTIMKLIDKDKVVAEINRILNSYDPNEITSGRYALVHLRDFIDTLEVKEVNLEEAIDKWIDDAAITHEDCSVTDVISTAKHFFELGLKARIDKELVEEVYSHIDSIKDTADRMTSGNFMHNRAAIKFSANTIAKVLELIGLKLQKGE